MTITMCVINQVISYWTSYRSEVSCIGQGANTADLGPVTWTISLANTADLKHVTGPIQKHLINGPNTADLGPVSGQTFLAHTADLEHVTGSIRNHLINDNFIN